MPPRTPWIPIVAIAAVVAFAFAAIPQWMLRDGDGPRPKPRRDARRTPSDEPETCPPDASFEEYPFAVRGKVVDERGRGVPAEVTVVGLEDVGPRAKTRENGAFRVQLMATDVVRIGVAAEGFRSHVSERIEVRPGGDVDLGTVRLAAAGAIAGVVVDDAGAEVAGASLAIESDEEVLPEGWAELAASTARWDRVRTDGDGAFRVDGLPPGRHRIRVRPGSRGDERAVVASGIAVGRTDLRIVVPRGLVARRYGVKVRVFGPDGDLVPGCRVWIAHPHDTVHSGRLGSAMDVEAFEPGPTWLVVRDAVDATGRALPWGPAAVRLDPSRRTLDVSLPRREGLWGRVEDAAGNPVETVLVAEGRLRADGTAVPTETAANVGVDWVRLPIPFVSKTDGSFEVSVLPQGRMRLRTESDSWRVVEPQHVSPGTAPVVVRLRRVGTVGLRVEAPAGLSLEEVSVRVLHARSGGDVVESAFTACGASASFDLRRSVLTDGPYAVDVRATAGGRTLRPGALRDLRPGDPRRTLALEPGATVDGLAVHRDGSPASDALVRAIRRDDPLAVPPTPGPARARADATGAFRLGGLEPGTWRLVVTTRGAVGAADVEVVAEDGGTKGVRVVLDASRSLAGRVSDDTGRGVEGFRVVAFDAEGRPVDAHVDGPTTDGHFVIHPLPVGSSRLYAWNAADAGDVRHALGGLVENGASEVALRLVPGIAPRGRVTTADGTPLEAAPVVVRGPGFERQVVTDEEGDFAFPGLPPGVHLVEARARDGGRGSGRSDGSPLEIVIRR